MDVIVIGKKDFSRIAAPEVLYCGQSREEALAVVAKVGGSYPYIYQVNPLPFQRMIYRPDTLAAAAPLVDAPASAPVPAEKTHDVKQAAHKSQKSRS